MGRHCTYDYETDYWMIYDTAPPDILLIIPGPETEEMRQAVARVVSAIDDAI